SSGSRAFSSPAAIMRCPSTMPGTASDINAASRLGSRRNESIGRRSEANHAAIVSDLTEPAIDVDRLLVQPLRGGEVAVEKPGRGKRAETTSERLRVAGRAHERKRFAQQALALSDALRREPCSAGSQEGAALMKIVAEFAAKRRRPQGFVMVGRIVEFPHLTGLPGQQLSNRRHRSGAAHLTKRFDHPAAMFWHKSELGPKYVAVSDELDPDGDVSVRTERPFQRATQIVDVGRVAGDPLLSRRGFPVPG